MKKTITSVARCGKCSALFGDHEKKFPLGEYRYNHPDEARRFKNCLHSRPGTTGPYHASDLSHHVPTPWFVYLYGAQS